MAYDAEVRVNTQINLNDFKKLNSEVERLEKRFASLKQKGDINEELGIKETTRQMKKLDIDTENTYYALKKARQARDEFVASHGLEGLRAEEAVQKLKDMGKAGEEAGDEISKSLKKSNGFLEKFAKRVKGLVLRIFVFSLITKALRAMVNGLKEGLQNLAQFSDEYNGIMSDFKSQTAQLKNSMATAFAPVIQAIIPYLTKFVEWLNLATDAIAQFFAVLGGRSTYAKAKKQTVDYAKSLKGVADQAERLANFDDINVLGKESGGAGGVETAFEEAEIAEEMFDKAKKFKEVFDEVKDVVEAIGIGILAWTLASKFTNQLDKIFAISAISAGLTLEIETIDEILKGEIEQASFEALLKEAFAGLGMGVGVAILTGNIWTIPVSVALSIVVADVIVNWESTKSMWANIFEGDFAGALYDWMGMDSWTTKLAQMMIDGIFGKGAWENTKEGLKNGLFELTKKYVDDSLKLWWIKLKSNVRVKFTEFLSDIRGFGRSIKDFVDNIGTSIWGGIKNTINKIIGGIEGMINRIIDGINGMIRSLNSLSFDIPDLMGGGRVGFNIGYLNGVTLPKLATGGITNRPTTALIGESGREAVLPLENNTEWMDILADRIGNGNVTIKFDGNLAQLARVLNPVLDTERTRVGTRLVVE